MLRVLNCLAVEHNHSLVLLAAAICVLSSLAVMRIYSGLKSSNGGVRLAFIALAALVGGSGIWTTHFIAMLAYEPGLKTAYDLGGTLASFGLAMLFSGLGVWAAAASTGFQGRLWGGALFGAGIGAMHYTGMLAFRTEGYVAWDASIVAVSLIFGVAIAAAAFYVAGAAGKSRSITAGLILTAAICSLHFTGMGAAMIVPLAGMDVATQELSNGAIAFAVGAVALLILLAGAGVILMGDLARNSATERMRRLANAAHEGLLLVRDGKVVDANAAFLSLAECRLSDIVGRDLDEGLLRRDGEGRNGFLAPHDGQPPIPVEVLERNIERASRGQAATVVLALRDLRERNAAEARIRYLAEHDSLTGLPNRHALKVKLEAALERASATGESIAVLCIDLDHFKEANDIHGHLAGDKLLAETARRIARELKAPSFAARLGGDEFVIVQIGDASFASSGALGGRIVDHLSQPVAYEGQHLVAGCSVGIALFPEDGRDVQTLLANADMALYRAKDSGRGTFCFFKREMDETIRDRRGLARDLRQSITDEILEVHYQPQASAADGKICGFEALARWTHPLRGPVSPAEFIPLAEESGMIGALGEWVLRRACADAAAWRQPLKLAVNLSPLQLHQRDLVKLVAEVLLETGLPASRLELEVTESALFKDYQRALDTLRQLKAMGVSIAMDDFGTGFSSLSTLQSFPFDKIKIDKSFVENINRDERANVIVRTVLGLGRSLEIPVVAEGVETDEQVAFLRGADCAELQGYAIGRPARVADMTDYVIEGVQPEARAVAA